jgi:hypothetical protein
MIQLVRTQALTAYIISSVQHAGVAAVHLCVYLAANAAAKNCSAVQSA